MCSTVKRTKECLAELEAQFNRETKTLSNVLIILGRTGSGKSSLLEDLSGLKGYSQQNADSVTKTMELCKTIIKDKPYFIMDTPGFDPKAEEKTFSEIFRGVESVRPFARITGFLYLTCIPQERFDDFDRKLIQFIRALSGAEYIPRVTFITTFWTATPGQAASYNQRLVSLQGKWEDGVGVQDLKTYQHGREYNNAGEDTRSVIDWYINREQIVRHAKEMVVRNYDSPSIVASKIERELDADVPIHETDAGRLLGLPAPSQSTPTAHAAAGSDQDNSPPTGASNPEHESGRPPLATHPSSNTNQEPAAPQPQVTSFGQVFLDWLGWVFRNVEFKVDVGGGGAGIGPSLVRGDPFRGGGDPVSHLDLMKSKRLDWSREGRLRYAEQHNIGEVKYLPADEVL
ncbi:hypothetical protein BDW59DRAFT_179028 [Aspergillus cavernicola]|uniref:G domain-containing protein n=1 Tax=Aspergillus cavernicola TaxID=176166 RepID=A0ABR4IJ19_9EURO